MLLGATISSLYSRIKLESLLIDGLDLRTLSYGYKELESVGFIEFFLLPNI